LTYARTFDSLYIQPILSVLKKQNPSSPFVPAPTHNGVFDTSSGQTLYLWVDVKTNGTTTWPYVVKALEPLRQGGWLTKYNGTGITNGTVTVIGTGNTPRDQVESQNNRDYFFDGPLSTLNSSANSNITQFLSPIASTSFLQSFGWPKDGKLNDTALAKLRGQISSAGARGIGTRYWVSLDIVFMPLLVLTLQFRKLPTGLSRTEMLSGVCFGMRVPHLSTLMISRESQTSGRVITKRR
jgi:hypothetical protein